MAYDILQSSTQAALVFLLVQSSDHITGLTGATATVTLSKNGSSFSSASGTIAELGNGWYKVGGNATDTNTLGPLALHATATSADPCDIVVANIISYNPQSATNLGLSALPTANPGATNGVFIAGTNTATVVNYTSNITGNLSGSVGSVTGAVGSVTARVTANADQWASGTIPAPNVTGVPLVDLKYTLGTISPAAAGSVSPDWGQVVNKTTAVALTATTISTSQQISSVIGAVGSVTGNVGGNVVGSVASVVGNVGGTVSTSQTISTVIGNVNGSVASVVGAVGSVAGIVSGSVASVVGNVGGTVSTSQVISTVLGNINGSVNSVTTAVGITSNRKKGAQATFEFLMQDSTTGAPKTGLTVAMTISKDGGAPGATSNSVTEIGLGQYQIVLTATEMTANNIFLQGTSAGALTFDMAIQTQL